MTGSSWRAGPGARRAVESGVPRSRSVIGRLWRTQEQQREPLALRAVDQQPERVVAGDGAAGRALPLVDLMAAAIALVIGSLIYLLRRPPH